MDNEFSAGLGKLVVSFHFKFNELKTGRRWKGDPRAECEVQRMGRIGGGGRPQALSDADDVRVWMWNVSPSNLEEGKYVLSHIFMGKEVGSYNVDAWPSNLVLPVIHPYFLK